MVVDNKATITYVQLLKEDLVIIRLVPKEGPVPEYKAGQFITLGLPNPVEGGKIVRRAYSIASHPENRDYVELVIRWVRKPLPGRLTTQLFNAKEGDEILWLKPTGRALLINEELPNGEKDNRRIICIGGGTGLAPFVSFDSPQVAAAAAGELDIGMINHYYTLRVLAENGNEPIKNVYLDEGKSPIIFSVDPQVSFLGGTE